MRRLRLRSDKIALETGIMALIKISNQSTPARFNEGQLIPERHNACAAYAQAALFEITQLLGKEEIDEIYKRWENNPHRLKG
jgi:hypothetical protein